MSNQTRVSLSKALAATGLSALFALCFLKFVLLQEIPCCDGFWHLWVGRLILESSSVPRADPICYSTLGFAWINLNWLAQFLYYRAFLAFGFAGSLGLASAVLGLSLVASISDINQRKSKILPACLVLAFLFYALVAAYSIRPRLFSFALLATFVWLLARPDPKCELPYPRAVLLLLLQLVWNNLHGGALYGIALLLLDAVGTNLDSWRSRGSLATKRSFRLLAVACLGVAGFAAHPHGVAALIHAASYPLQMTPQFFSEVTELRPIDISSTLGIAFLAYTALSALALFSMRKQLKYRELLPLLVFFALAVKYQRGFTLFAIVSAPFVAYGLSCTYTNLLQSKVFAYIENTFCLTLKILPTVISAFIAIWLTAYMPLRNDGNSPGLIRSWLVSESAFPVAASELLKQQASDGRIFNGYNAGGFLGWALFPHRRIFIDGRGDLHSRGDNLASYLRVTNLNEGWLKELERNNVKFVLDEANSRLVNELINSHSWKPLYSDSKFRLIVKPDATDTGFD